VSQNTEPVIIVNATSDDGLALAREFHSAGRMVIGVVAEVDKDFEEDISCLSQLLVGDVELLARAACHLNNFCEVIYC